MSRPMFLLSLIAALSGTPLRQTEAAHDFACSVAELGCGDVIETADGGVGDDAGDTIRADASQGPVMPSDAGVWLVVLPAAPPTLSPALLVGSDRAHAPPPASASRRQARLQRFLF